jgi:acetyl-CoA carboxylase carboxyltransferase component
MMLDGAGYRADGRAHARAPTDLLAQGRCSGRVPLVTAVLGSSAGHGALVAPMSDFTVMSRHAVIFTAGPPVVLESLAESVTKEELGGPSVAVASGLVHNAAADDRAALDLVRRYLGYFPSSAWSYPPDAAGDDTAARLVPEIVEIVPRSGRRLYEMRRVVEVVFDRSSVFEVQPEFGRSVVCALARLGGHPVAVVANQPRALAGSVDVDGADKAARFITVADSFHLPLVFLADNPGVMPGRASEKRGILRSGARMFTAQTLATSPKLQVTLRKAYGFGSMVMAMIPFDGQSAVFAFPGATMGAMGAAAMSRATGADEGEAERLRRAELEASYRSAGSLGFDELIDPREIRNVLLHALARALHRRQAAPEPVARIGILP